MQKTTYKKELQISATQKKYGTSNNKMDVLKIQSWLTLFSMSHANAATATGVDGDFGPATELAVKNFQKIKGLRQNGIVDKATFDQLITPMRNAFEGDVKGHGLRKLVVQTASLHVKNRPFELVVKGQFNAGPWVRSYMDGNEGNPWYWCMGFVQAIIDQASSRQGKNFKTLMPLTYSCDVIGGTGLKKGLLARYTEVRKNPALAKPGDIFLLQKTAHNWVHTGIITAVGPDTFECIEGNTNSGGSRNGIAVLKRIRNFRQSKLDVFSIDPLV